MSRYKHGLVFNFQRHLKQHDPGLIFHDVDQYRLLTHVVRFLTEDVYDKRMGKEQLNEIEFLMGQLYNQEIIPDFLIGDNDAYSYVYCTLFAICESIVILMEEMGFYEKIIRYGEEARVIRNNKDNFTIVVKELR